MSVSAFSKQFKSIATDFIKNVVVIDDQAFLGSKRAVRAAENAAANIEQVREADDSEPIGLATAQLKPVDTLLQPPTAIEGNVLDAKSLIDGFASLGVFCAVLEPIHGEEAKASEKLIANADIVILDWYIGAEAGTHVEQIIENLLAPEGADRMRLVAI